ncbi:ComEC/Rec2 family competence protein [Paraburkholderia sp. BR10937]|uniref:ComEC/Rec2 family competence protein n=1 Tax=Paraburkholderia sp. BR10937 TaxID=3236994 RepID=UPI0034D26EB3
MSVNPFVDRVRDSVGLKSVKTRFRAYQLGEAGSSYSYFADGHFTLIEARRTEAYSHKTLTHELAICGKQTIDVLHITSWDIDHCNPGDLEWILQHLKPAKIEYPGYEPHTDSARESLKLIRDYRRNALTTRQSVSAIRVDPDYINSLDKSQNLGYQNILYHPKKIYENNSNNNSTVKLFRTGSFNVASLGDIEDSTIGAYLRACRIFCREVDILVLPHHGAPSKITTQKFLEEVRPTVAICTSNYDNQYSHPCQEIRDILYELDIPIFTTKTGDVVIESVGKLHNTKYHLTNLNANSQKVSSEYDFNAKKARLLSQNADTLRNIYKPGFKGLR